MDRVNQLRGCAGGSGDSSLESSPGSEGYLTANDSSKYYSLSEVDSSLDVTPDKDVSLSSAADSTISASDQFADLSPISKKSDLLDSYKIGKHIEAANILSGGVDIFDDDNDTSCDGNELIIDDNVGDLDDKSNELKIIEEDEGLVEPALAEGEAIPSKDTEVSLQIDGRNVNAIDIGNGLYLYRKGDLQEELAAVQIIDADQQQPSFKFLKVRENAEGNLEVYEEIEVEVPKTAPQKSKPQHVKTGDSHVPIKGINKVINDPTTQNSERKISSPPKTVKSLVSPPGCSKTIDIIPEVKTDVKTITTEAKVSPLLGFHSTPNKEGIPLTKTMVDQQLHPNRHSDNVKKTIEVNTDSCKFKLQESPVVDATDSNKAEKSGIENSPDNPAKIDSGSSIEEKTEIAKVSLLSAVEKDHALPSTPPKTEGQKATTPPKQTLEESTSSANNKVAKILDFTSPIKTVTAEATSTTTIKTCSDNFDAMNNTDKTPKNPKTIDKAKTINLVEKSVNNEIKIPNEPLVSKPVDQKTPVKPDLNHNKDNLTKTSQASVPNSMGLDKVVPKAVPTTKEIQSDTNHINKDIASPTKPLEAAISHVKPLEAAISPVKPLEAAKSHVKPLTADISHVKPLEAALSHVKPLATDVSHVKPLTADISHVKPSEPAISHVKPLAADISHVKPMVSAISHVKPLEAAINDVKPLEATISHVKPLVAAISHVKPLETAISHVKPLEAAISHVKPLEAAISHVKPLEAAISHVKPLGANKGPKIIKTANENKALSETTAAPKANAFTSSPKAKIDQSNETKKDFNVTNIVDTTENVDKKNTSDDLIQLNDLGVVTEKKPLDYVEPIELVNEMTKSPIKFDNIHDTKIHINPKTKEAPKPLVAAHAVSSIPLPLFTKIEQKPFTSIPESKPKPLDKNALVNKYVNKALVIKSVTSGPVGDHKFGLNKPAATSTTTLLDARGLNLTTKKEVPKVVPVDTKPKSINNNNAVPFGKWTEANKQAYLNKIKETKVVTNPNTNQIKQPYDLNRRDVLKKIDSQRQQVVAHSHAARSLEQNKMTVKKETPMFVQKSTLKPDAKPPVKVEPPKPKLEVNKPAPRRDIPETVTQPRPNEPSGSRKDKRTDFHNQDIINRTIEDILMDRKSPNETPVEAKPVERPRIVEKQYNRAPTKSMGLVDDIEMKMNELHGIPHERLQESRYNHDIKTYTKPKTYEYDSKSYLASRGNKIPSLVPIRPTPKFATIDVDEEEVLEHPPVTGDMELKKASPTKALAPGPAGPVTAAAKKDGGITEKDFEKFARRNSITYNDNCIALNYDTKQPHVVEDVVLTKYTIGSNSKSAFHQHVPTNFSTQNHSSKFMPIRTDDGLKSSQSNKFQMAYNSALTAMRQKESPITVIEDKPVKVVYMEPNAEYVPSRLNVQGKELSPAKKPLIPEPDASTHSSCDSLDGEVQEVIEVAKSPEKSRTQQPPLKHQRKQVLTPVDAPDMELVAASELTSPKKKRKIEETKANNSETTSKSVLPKKTYLLGRNTVEEVRPEPQMPSETVPMSAASAIDNLVKAAEMLENQSKNMQLNTSTPQDVTDTPTPVKRGRGRPRKNPLPDVNTSIQNKSISTSPQKKPRVSKPKSVTSSEESSDDDEAVVNWSMGKINENIVCPICNKLFRTENVVFKHVKHCTGPSPSRSDTNTRSSRRTRQSYDSMQDITDSNDSFDKVPEKTKKDSEKSSETKKDDKGSEKEKCETKKKEDKPKSNAEVPKEASGQSSEDTKIKHKAEKPDDAKNIETKSSATKVKQKPPLKSNLVCEICNKSFRQLSYLVSHKLTHKKDEPKQAESSITGSVFSCEVCKKEFRKLHHLVQHRLIHTSTSRSRRKSSAETLDKNTKEKPEDPSAGFRCEPCDKSFRKLHHLVEHRETHDGINRQKTTSAPVVPEKDKSEPPPPQCNICNKTFRKLHHLIEHKEQHVEASSEKSDDKSVKSSLSTRDIIHECSLCYMVFPNEHSLNKHTVNCQKKKRQSISKPSKVDEDSGDDIALSKIAEDAKAEEKICKEKVEEKPEQQAEVKPAEEKPVEVETKNKEPEPQPAEAAVTAEEPKAKKPDSKPEQKIIETILIEDTPKKKESKAPKDKLPATVTKRQKSTNLELPVIEESKPSSDDDEVRYMLNPNFKADDQEGKFFMKVRANKRNSLQIERPNSKNLITRRVSLQNPPKIPRLKPKKIEVKEVVKPVKTEVPSTDSDDSDVKYSFPEPPKEEVKSKVEKVKRKTIAEKRKSLSGIAKRKSLGKSIVSKSAAKSIPVAKTARKRISEIEHRCDCGQLFSSAALLSRHTSLAHTPPRLRRARNSPTPTQPARKSTKPESKPRKSDTQTDTKPAKKPEEASKKLEPTRRKSDRQAEPKTAQKSEPEKTTRKEETLAKAAVTRKSSARSDTTKSGASSRKSSVNIDKTRDEATPSKRPKKDTDTATKSRAKLRRTATHAGVPVPDKMRKLLEKLKQ